MDKIDEALNQGRPVILKTSSLPMNIEQLFQYVLEKCLIKINKSEIKESLIFCLREVTANAKRANIKRIYFLEKGINIDNVNEYQKGMKGFKTAISEKLEYYEQKLTELGFYIKVGFFINKTNLEIKVINNAPINLQELQRINERMAQAYKFKTFDEAMSTIMDESEGAGLGIAMIILMLRNLGIDRGGYVIQMNGGETLAKLTIPLGVEKPKAEDINLITKKLIQEVDSIPQFPDNISKIRDLLDDEKSTIRVSHKNPLITQIYKEYFTAPNSEKAHHLLHTTYTKRCLYNE